MKKLLVTFVLLAALCWAQPKTETGEINGAKFRIDVPERWNGGLVMYCHGYSATPGRYGTKPNPVLNVFLEEGYAVAQSGYAVGGWVIPEAIQDTEALRRYFATKYGAAKETFVTGHSMGGHLTVTILETFPQTYDGGLALCAALSEASTFMEHVVFDRRVVFDYFFPDALPSPAKVPAEFAGSPSLNEQIEKLIESKPEQAAAVRRYAGIKNNRELAATVVFFTYILKDLQQRGGGNAFDNRNTIYEGSGDDNALNDGVKRYTADARAAEYVRGSYRPTGRLSRPLLAIQTTYDQLIPAAMTNSYGKMTEDAGSGDLFVQQYVKRDGHCAILPAEVKRGFQQLREWKAGRKRPPGGAGQ